MNAGTSGRLSIEDVREALGDEAAGLSDVELIDIREHAFEMAGIVIRRADNAARTTDDKAFRDAMSAPASRD